ncbi:uncharacterized protein N7483_003563 [Penicillium malachiteum]|uniref:uncharacterized protein n=1 Tax=Penicillium malachiteum TaxID=1324776 RepID=UPI0025474987|nr:uncharacterized protein N7483_003563 [Penicillium malachiteum]KAJ5729055.1 hypothetical protein N7483_003563 [Penicillium malachiteum]
MQRGTQDSIPNSTRRKHFTPLRFGYGHIMDSRDQELDPFSSASLWRLSRFSVEALHPLDDLPWNAGLFDISESAFTNFEKFDDIDPIWKLNFSTDIEPPESSVHSSIDASIDAQSCVSAEGIQEKGTEDDIWALDLLQPDPGFVVPLKSWEKFENRSFQEPVSAYFSESGVEGFDAALADISRKKGLEISGRAVRETAFVRSLLRLGLGWSSPFFRCDPKTMKLEKYISDIRVSGVSQSITDMIVEDVLRCGTNMQYVRKFARNLQTKSKDLSSVFTLRGTVAVIIYHFERQIMGHSDSIITMLQAATLFHRCGDLIQTLAEIVKATEKASSDAEVISIVMDHAAFLAQRFGWMENLVQEIVVRVTEPWLGFIEGWIGLRPEGPALNDLIVNGKTFIQVEKYDDPIKFRTRPSRFDYAYRGDHMPSFIPHDQAQLIFESGKSLRLLKKSHPHHPIGRHDVLARTGHLRMHCATTWTEIEQIQRKAQEYEANLRAEILRYHKGDSKIQPTDDGSVPSDPATENNEIVEKTFNLFDIDGDNQISDSAMYEKTLSEDKISDMLQRTRGEMMFSDSETRFGPELASELYLSFAPVISSQAQLIDFSCLHHLFKEHDVRHHLNLQWRFQLLGDGTFASRLSHSLFDPEMESGERKTGVVRSGVHTGLRLGNRDTWPPASSELRLVLIGLLGDCYFSEKKPDPSDKASTQENELPGGLSFAIRELSSEEIERCRDPNAIEALDFLRLQYKPSDTLEALITPRSLSKYDRLFKHLLRLLRMVSVVKGIVRDSTVRDTLAGDTRNVFQKFRIDAQHFVLAISDYCFHVGIGSTWSRFQDTLDKIERCLNRGDIDGTLEAAHSVPRLRDLHEDILDQMLFAFFLSKRHTAAAKLLDNIFSTILAFSSMSRADGSGLRHENEGQVLHLYSMFRKQVSTFIAYLRGLESGKGASKTMVKSAAFFGLRNEPTSVFEHLRVRLEVKDYY